MANIQHGLYCVAVTTAPQPAPCQEACVCQLKAGCWLQPVVRMNPADKDHSTTTQILPMLDDLGLRVLVHVHTAYA